LHNVLAAIIHFVIIEVAKKYEPE